MTGNKKIFFLTASDRINYGDLLFPLIFKELSKNKGFIFYNAGIIKSDLSHFGGLPTYSYKELLSEIKKSKGKLVIGGGEVFFADWKTLYGFINPFYARCMNNKWLFNKEKRFRLAKLFLVLNGVAIPFCPSKEELKNDEIEIYYSSVGGSYPYGKSNNEINTIKRALNDASLISVRDKRTEIELKKLSIKSEIVPDSALLISDIFTEEYIRKNLKADVSRLNRPYIFLQMGINKGPKDLEKFVEDVKKISEELELEVVLCPIGIALGHQDDIILKKLKRINDSFYYFEPKNIFDIMMLISKASLYMGTSLHGVITAQAFQTPFIGLNEKLIKVDKYTKTWIGEEYSSLPFNEVLKVIDIYENWNFSKLLEKTEEQKKLVRKNIDLILNGN